VEGLQLQVNRALRDVILASPLTRHKIDLLAAGLEYNAAAGISLAESKKAFDSYRSNLDSLQPTEERTVKELELATMVDADPLRTAGGVCAALQRSLRLFAPGPGSRGIPYKEWEIPLPDIKLDAFGFYPSADVIAFAGLEHSKCVHWL